MSTSTVIFCTTVTNLLYINLLNLDRVTKINLSHHVVTYNIAKMCVRNLLSILFVLR